MCGRERAGTRFREGVLLWQFVTLINNSTLRRADCCAGRGVEERPARPSRERCLRPCGESVGPPAERSGLWGIIVVRTKCVRSKSGVQTEPHLSEVGCNRAAAANVESVFSGAGKFTEEAKSLGSLLLRRMVKHH